MTKKQRADVVELLRCAADSAESVTRPIACASRWLGNYDSSDDFLCAIEARRCVSGMVPSENEEYRAQILEAAQRLEEGSYP